jgi:hypothetical protein
MLKAYVNFFRKAHILEMSPATIIFDAVRRLHGREDEKAALNKLEKFVEGRDGGFEGMSDPLLTVKARIVVNIVERPLDSPFSL